MLDQLIAIIRNTFFESIRQPIALVIVLVAALAILLCNPLSSFTMENDQRMYIDMGLATIFLCGTLLAAFIATNVLTREIENRTALTVISKPVGRPVFIIGKFLGVAGAIAICTLNMSLVFMLVELHEVRQRVLDPYHGPVLVFGIGAGLLAVATAIWANYFYSKVFASTLICVSTPLLLLAYVLSLMFDHDFKVQSMSLQFKPQLWLALIALTMAILVLSAIAIAISTRAGQVLTLVLTLAVFVGGMLSDHFIGRHMTQLEAMWMQRAVAEGSFTEVDVAPKLELTTGRRQESLLKPAKQKVPTVALTSMAQGSELMQYGAMRAVYSVLPNFQVLWLSDALTQEHRIPASYITRALLYGVAYIVIALAAATILFQRREVG
jgi:ABC-type transport system involved in multi-copper enzyme maturation permease subunit